MVTPLRSARVVLSSAVINPTRAVFTAAISVASAPAMVDTLIPSGSLAISANNAAILPVPLISAISVSRYTSRPSKSSVASVVNSATNASNAA